MSKYKAKKKHVDTPPQVKPGVPCLVILIGGMIIVMITLILVMRNAS
jgi:uncharacterized integral membrane protein